MKHKILILTTTILLLTVGGNATAQISDNFTLQQSNMVFQQNGLYKEISIDGCSFTDEIGNPQLPVFTETFVLPYNAVVTNIQVTTISNQQISGNYFIYPAQSPVPLNGSEAPPFAEPNAAVYNSNTPYPNKTVEIISDGYMHGYHIVTVKIYPVSYFPASGEIYLRSYNYTINYTLSNNSEETAKQSAARAELSKFFIELQVKKTVTI